MIGWRLASIAGAIAIWWLIALAMPANLLPDPWVSAMTLAKNFAQGDVLPHLAITLARVAGGLAVAMVIGVPVGILMGINLRAEKILDIWVMVGLTVPSLCYAIICFILVGLNESATVLAIGLTAAPSTGTVAAHSGATISLSVASTSSGLSSFITANPAVRCEFWGKTSTGWSLVQGKRCSEAGALKVAFTNTGAYSKVQFQIHTADFARTSWTVTTN